MTTPAAIPPLDPTATALFAACEATWQDDRLHDKFVKYCSAAGLLAAAALQYRRYLDQHPGDALAAKMQQRIVTMASLLLTTRNRPAEPMTRSRWFMILIALSAIGGAVAAIFYRQ
jgi:hypothetical protein